MKDTVGSKISKDLAAKQMYPNFYYLGPQSHRERGPRSQSSHEIMWKCRESQDLQGWSKCPLTEVLVSSSRLRSLRGRRQTWPHTSQPLLFLSNQNQVRDASSPQISVPWSTCFKMLKELPRKASGLVCVWAGASRRAQKAVEKWRSVTHQVTRGPAWHSATCQPLPPWGEERWFVTVKVGFRVSVVPFKAEDSEWAEAVGAGLGWWMAGPHFSVDPGEQGLRTAAILAYLALTLSSADSTLIFIWGPSLPVLNIFPLLLCAKFGQVSQVWPIWRKHQPNNWSGGWDVTQTKPITLISLFWLQAFCPVFATSTNLASSHGHSPNPASWCVIWKLALLFTKREAWSKFLKFSVLIPSSVKWE